VKNLIYSLAVISLFYSCSGEEHPDAKSLCDCYTELHRTYTEEQTERVADSCNTIYSDIIQKYKGDEEGKTSFESAYKNCQ